MESKLILLPAIDLQNGRCVRLRQGNPDDATVYSDDPVAMAKRWADAGATWLHVVDLDGAFRGEPVHADLIRHMVKAAGIPVEVGGGLRTDDDLQHLIDHGVARVIVGTRALADIRVLEGMVNRFGEQFAVGIDARDGMVQVRGWAETSAITALELADRADRAGVQTLIDTDTARDGMLGGVNVPAVEGMCRAVSCNVIASGGVSSVDDVRRLRSIGCANLQGAIVGKALYEGTVDLGDMIRAASGQPPAGRKPA